MQKPAASELISEWGTGEARPEVSKPGARRAESGGGVLGEEAARSLAARGSGSAVSSPSGVAGASATVRFS